MPNLIGRFFPRKPETFQGYTGSGMLISSTIKAADQVNIVCSGNFHLRAGGDILLKGGPQTKLDLSMVSSQLACNGKIFAVAPDGFEIYADAREAQFQVNDRWYRGSLYTCLIGNQISVTNSLGLSQFLYQVLPHQVPVGWPIEALKAQAIVSRGIALSGGSLPYGDLSDVYEQSIQAVDETDGLVLSSRSGIFQTFEDLLKSTVVCDFDANSAYELALQGLTAKQVLAELLPNVFLGRVAIGS